MDNLSIYMKHKLMYRKEDFGTLVTNGGKYLVVNESGERIIDYLNSLEKDTLCNIVSNYISKFKFKNTTEKESAINIVTSFIMKLVDKKMVYYKYEQEN